MISQSRLHSHTRRGNTGRLPLAALAAVSIACQDRALPDAPPASESPDYAGVRIVENARPAADSRLPWRIGPGPTVSIGEATGDEPYMLYRAIDAVTLADGRIVIANAGTNELRVFDAAGVHMATWGGSGEGPGEFMALAGVDAWPGDSVVAWDGRDRSIAVFGSRDGFSRSFVMESGGDRPLEPRFALADGSFLGRFGESSGEGYQRAEVAYERRDGEGAERLSYGVHPGDESFVGTIGEGIPFTVARLPFSRRILDGAWGDLVIIAPNDDYHIPAYNGTDGSLATIVRREFTTRAPTRAEADETIEESLVGAGLPEEAIEMVRGGLEDVPLVERLPAFGGLLVDAIDHLWVREATLPGMEPRAPLWTVFDPEGRALGFVETPDGLTILEIGTDYLLGHRTDDLEFESVQVWPLGRGRAVRPD